MIMKKAIALLVVFLILAVPTMAQDTVPETYTTDAGTNINYPRGWQAELVDNLVIISEGQGQQAIIIDYPLLSVLSETEEITPLRVLEFFVRDVADLQFDQRALSTLEVQTREAVRYDVSTADGLPSSIFAVRFSNDAVGMVIFFGVNEGTIDAMLNTFNNSSAAQDVQTANSGSITTQRTGLYLFRDGAGRFAFPPGWQLTSQRSGDIEYAVLGSPDAALNAVVADLSTVVTLDTAVSEVLNATNLDFETTFGVDLAVGLGEFVVLGDHSGVRYEVDVVVDGETLAGDLTVIEYSEGGFGLVLLYGDLEAYSDVQTLFINSLNNKFYGLDQLN